MKLLLILTITSFISISSNASCLERAFERGAGYLNNYYVLDEPPVCCDDIKVSAKEALKEVLIKKLECNNSEIEKIINAPIECIGLDGGMCQIKLPVVVIQIAIEYGEQPITHIIFNDNH